MRVKGRITSWNDEKGFGFITPNGGGKHIFVHIKAFISQNRPIVDQTVTYSMSADKRGRPCAEKVTRSGESLSKNRQKNNNPYYFLIIILFIAIIISSVLTKNIPFIILPYYLAISILTFCWYWKDKLAAQNDNWRTPENTLHLLSLIGGWPGGLVAQKTLRHKSKKQSFRSRFWATVFLNLGVFLWLYTPQGKTVLHILISSYFKYIT